MKKTNKNRHTIMSIHEEVKGEFEIIKNCLIIKVREDLDHHNAIYIREQTDKLIMNKNIKHIIFDFSATSFMDSSGIGVIMGRYKNIALIGGSIYFTGINNNINRIFKLSGLYKIIDKYDRVQDVLDIIEGLNKKNK